MKDGNLLKIYTKVLMAQGRQMHAPPAVIKYKQRKFSMPYSGETQSRLLSDPSTLRQRYINYIIKTKK